MTLRPRRNAVLLVLLPLVLGVVAGCWSEGPRVESGGGFTAPGSTVELGETVTVRRSNDAGTIELTITGIEPGDQEDLRRAGFPKAARQTPYYVHYELRPLTVGAVDFRMLDYVSVWAGDRPLDHVTLLKEFPPCEEKAFPTNATTSTTLVSCMTWLAPDGDRAPDRVVFDNNDDYAAFDGNHVTWE